MNIHPIETGFFSTDGGAMFGIVSRKVWFGKYPSDSENRCPLALRVLFVDMGVHKVLFDTGVGTKRVRGASYYRFHDLRNLVEELNKYGYRPEDVTDVVFSHLHFDHCGGAACVLADGRMVPAFPNAVFWVGKRQWPMSQNPPLWEADSFAPEVAQTLQKTGKLRLVDSDQELFPGVKVKLCQGHTDDQLVSYIETPIGTIVYCGDVIPMATHVIPLCIAAVDNSAVLSVDEKMRILKEAVEKNQILFFFHDAVNEAVRLKQMNGKISVKETLKINTLLCK